VISAGCGMMVVAKQSSRHKMWTYGTTGVFLFLAGAMIIVFAVIV
jgi:hypothetical protein